MKHLSGKQQFVIHLNDISPLSSQVSDAILNMLSEVKIKKNHDLQSIGQTCKTIYFVQQGVARIYYYKDGKDVTEYFAFENDLIIRAESLFTGKPSHKAIQSISDTNFIAIPARQLFALFDQHRDIERLFRKIVEHSYVDTINRLESLQFHAAEERYRSLIEKSPEVIQEIPLKHIASYLGITQVSLSRIRANIS
ncbi:MAG: Crp/Fnr family transcriptional regulator [Imperialibacter sp.]|uniref:Crp/Fnr family transcriptional regulator n=1 Tax=Imperialibacter sp. TaxID=2038411 RepID=UPI0032EBCC8F